MRSLSITNGIQSPSGIRWHRVCGLLAPAVPALLLSAKLLLAVYAAAGDLDPSFGAGGKIEGNSYNALTGYRKVTIQADGKLLMLGPWSPAPLQHIEPVRFKLLRFKPDGTLDPGFGSNGIASTDFGAAYEDAGAMAIQPNGRIVVAGQISGNVCTEPCPRLALARFLPNGMLDSSFGNGGQALGLANFLPRDLTFQSNGKIIIVGLVTFPDGSQQAAMVRYQADGSLDSSFGGFGIVFFDLPTGTHDQFNRVVLQTDGKIVVLANDFYPFVYPGPYVLRRYYSTGTLNTTFGVNGQYTAASDEGGIDMRLQADGKILVAGGSLYRHQPDGALDLAFGSGGKTSVDNSTIHSVALQEDGKLVVAGGKATTGGTFNRDCLVARLQADGSLDTGFGVNGQVVTEFSQGYGIFDQVLLQSDGRIVAGGYTINASAIASSIRQVLARYLNDDGTPAPADLRIGKVLVSPATVQPGDLITYTIPVTNVGPGKAGHVTLTTQTATHTTFQGFSAPPGWVIYKRPAPFSAGVISCSAYELPAGSTVNFYLTVRVSSSIAPGTQISHASTVSSFMPDPNETNNTATRTITVQ